MLTLILGTNWVFENTKVTIFTSITHFSLNQSQRRKIFQGSGTRTIDSPHKITAAHFYKNTFSGPNKSQKSIFFDTPCIISNGWGREEQWRRPKGQLKRHFPQKRPFYPEKHKATLMWGIFLNFDPPGVPALPAHFANATGEGAGEVDM